MIAVVLAATGDEYAFDPVLGYGWARLDPGSAMGRRVSNLVHARSGLPLEPSKRYIVTGWGSVSQTVQGPPIWDVIGRYLARNRQLAIRPKDTIQVTMGPTQKL